jgi:fibronectin type 3 domain-containing protein
VERLIVEWPSGIVLDSTNIYGNQFLTLIEPDLYASDTLIVSSETNGYADLLWTTVVRANYYVYRSTNDSLPVREWSRIATVTNDTIYTDAPDSAGMYYYYVTAFMGCSQSPVSNIVSIEVELPELQIDTTHVYLAGSAKDTTIEDAFQAIITKITTDSILINITDSIPASASRASKYISKSATRGSYPLPSLSKKSMPAGSRGTDNLWQPIPDNFFAKNNIPQTIIVSPVIQSDTVAVVETDTIYIFAPEHPRVRDSLTLDIILTSPPKSLTVKDTLGNAFLSWAPANGAPTDSFRLYRTTGDTVNFQIDSLITLTTASYIDSISSDSIYTYAVTAFYKDIESEPSESVSFILAPVPDSIWVIGDNKNAFAVLSWDSVAVADSYSVYRDVGGYSDFEHVTTVENTTFTDVLDSAGTYSYYVTAFNGSLQSDPTDTVSVTITIPQIQLDTLTVYLQGDLNDATISDSINITISGLADDYIFVEISDTTAIASHNPGESRSKLIHQSKTQNFSRSKTFATRGSYPLQSRSGNGAYWQVSPDSIALYVPDTTATFVFTPDYSDTLVIVAQDTLYLNNDYRLLPSDTVLINIVFTSPPKNLKVKGVSDSTVLSWSSPTGYPPDRFTVYRTDDTLFVFENAQEIITVTDPSYNDTTAVDGINYIYAVTAWYNDQQSLISNTVSHRIIPSPYPLYVSNTPKGYASLSWNFVAIADSYRIYRDTSPYPENLIATFPKDSLSFIDAPDIGGIYYYAVTTYVDSLNLESDPVYSDSVNVLLPQLVIIPKNIYLKGEAATANTATDTITVYNTGNDSLSITFKEIIARSLSRSKHHRYIRSTSDSLWEATPNTITLAPADSQFVIFNALSSDSAAIIAQDTLYITDAYNDRINDTLLIHILLTAPPESLIIDDHDFNRITMSWIPPQGQQPVKFNIYRTIDTNFSLIDTVIGSVTAYTDSSIVSDSTFVTYQYKLTATYADQESQCSNTVTINIFDLNQDGVVDIKDVQLLVDYLNTDFDFEDLQLLFYHWGKIVE